MSEIVNYEFNGNPVRTTIEGEQAWFCGRDICEQLEYTNPSKAINDHCKGVTKRYPLQTAGGTQEAVFISEPDVWRLICSSQQPRAVELERWIFEEVLPAIRRTGRYDLTWRHTEQLCGTSQPMVLQASGRVTVTVTPTSDGEGKTGAGVTVEVQPPRAGIVGKQESANVFFQTRLCTIPGNQLPSLEVYEAYCLWCEENRHSILNVAWFGKRLHDWFPEVYKVRVHMNGGRRCCYFNLGYVTTNSIDK